MKRLVALLSFWSLALHAAGSADPTSSEALEACYKFDKKKVGWVRHCGSWNDFVQKIELSKVAAEHRILYARLAIEELKATRETELVLPPPKPRLVGRPILIQDPSAMAAPRFDFLSLFDSTEKSIGFDEYSELVEVPLRSESLEGEFLKNTQPIVEFVANLLKPLNQKGNVLQSDAAYLELLANGESLRFERTLELVKTRWKEISASPLRQRDVYRRMAYWTKSFGAIPLREWFYDEMVRVRPGKITGRRPIELFYYLESLRLSQPNLESPAAVSSVVKTLRTLWNAHTSKEERNEIQSLVDTLRLKQKFHPPTIDELSPEELLVQVQSHVRRLDGETALKTVSHIIKNVPRSKITDENLWETFQVHVRILRILDRRSEIPDLISSYADRGKYLILPSKGVPVDRAVKRLIEIAKLEWTYGSHARALGILQRLQTFGKEKPFAKSLRGEIVYIKARIMEQGKDKDLADLAMNDALVAKVVNRDQEYDLRWRLFFLRINMAYLNKNFSTLGSELDTIEPLAGDPYEKLRLLFWRGTLALYQEKKDDAKGFFAKVYKAEPMSYYGNLAALTLKALGENPERWLKPAKVDIDEPRWESFVSKDGVVKVPAFRNLGRALLLQRASAADWVPEALDDLSSQLWSYVPSKKAGSLSQRLDYARASMWFFTHAGEPMAALRAADIVVTNLKEESPYDLNFLYPLAFWEHVQKYSAERKIDPWFTVSLIRQESAFKVNARSWANALGLMQMIPPVATNEAKIMGIQNFENEMLLGDPELSVRLGTHHLGGLLQRFRGSWMCVLAGYNAGYPPVVDWLRYYPSPIPLTFVERISYTETRLYVMTIYRNFMNYHRIHGEGKVSLAELNQLPSSP